MYYYENNRLNRYYAKYENQLFKTREEYLAWANQNGLKLEKISCFRLAKHARKGAEYPEGKWMEYDLVPGTFLFDERDLSIYRFQTQEEAEELLKVYNFNADVYDVCPFEGYEETEARNELQVEAAPFDATAANRTFAHFILSYLPDDKEKRAKRYAAHLNQIENIKKITPTARIYIVAQNYAENEYLTDPRIEYRKFPGGLGAGRARNECLKWLYESDYAYGIISDDDSLLAVTDSAVQFFSEFEASPDKFIEAGIDVCYPRNMYHHPWNMSDVAKANWRSANWEFVWAASGWFHWTLFRNLKKAYGKEIYQREDLNPSLGQGYDDMDFSYALIDSGVRCYTECTVQLISQLVTEDCSVVQSVGDGNYRAKSLNATRSKYLRRTPNGGWDYDDLRARNGHPFSVTVRKERETDVWGELSGGRTDDMKADFINAKSAVDPI